VTEGLTLDGTADSATGIADDLADDAARGVTLPVGALAALRGAVLAAPDGQLRLRDAGFAAGGALYEAFAERARPTPARGAGDALPGGRGRAVRVRRREPGGDGPALGADPRGRGRVIRSSSRAFPVSRFRSRVS
jgi:hypothetical protein